MKIKEIRAREILDSRGKPTVAASCELSDGVLAEASVPSGASTGKEEAYELRDGDKKRFFGMGVLSAVSNIEELIAPELVGMEARDQSGIDQRMCKLDGTKNKDYLGANAILAVSLAVARAQAVSDEVELFEYLATKFQGSRDGYGKIPAPMFNILNGGKHADNNIDIQETMIVPLGPKSFAAKLRAGAEIYQSLRNELISEGYEVGLGDEGGFAPSLRTNEDVFRWAERAVREAGYKTSSVRLSTDIAADSFYDKKSKTYRLESDGRDLDSKRMISLIAGWVRSFNLLSVEDGLYEDDPNWNELTTKIKPAYSVGDDLLVTDQEKIEQAAEKKLANGVIIKLNQVGTLSEALEAIRMAQKKNFKVIVSHRSGETSDPFIADLAVAVGANFIKSGAPARSERLSKYNRLLKIEELIDNKSR